MKTIRAALELFDRSQGDLLMSYQKISCHVIWNVNLGENFRRKYRLVDGGHTTTTPILLTYLSFLTIDSFNILLTIEALKTWT